MSANLDRLRHGERWWAAEFVLRTLGIALLESSQRLALIAHRMITTPPVHQASPAELAICAAAFFALSGGLAFAIEGPGLFRDVPMPPHSAYF